MGRCVERSWLAFGCFPSWVFGWMILKIMILDKFKKKTTRTNRKPCLETLCKCVPNPTSLESKTKRHTIIFFFCVSHFYLRPEINSATISKIPLLASLSSTIELAAPPPRVFLLASLAARNSRSS